MNAQDFHGVSIGGTLQVPTIRNSPDNPAIYGYVLVKHSTTIPHNFMGVDGQMIQTTDYAVTHNVFSLDRIIHSGGIAPGEEAVPGNLILGVTTSSIDPITKTEVPQGQATGWEVKGVLFSSGAFYGEDRELSDMTDKVYLARSYARDVQYQTDREDAMNRDSHMEARARASMSPGAQHRKTLAATLLMIKDQAGLEEMDKVLSRIAGLPDVVKGEQK